MDHRENLLAFLRTVDPLGRNPVQGDRVELDSLGLLNVINYLEQTYGMKLAGLPLEPEDLRTMSGLMGLIERHTASA